MIFADDTQIYLNCPPSEIDFGTNRVAHDFGIMASYASDNGLKLNLSKSDVIRSKTFVGNIDLGSFPLEFLSIESLAICKCVSVTCRRSTENGGSIHTYIRLRRRGPKWMAQICNYF